MKKRKKTAADEEGKKRGKMSWKGKEDMDDTASKKKSEEKPESTPEEPNLSQTPVTSDADLQPTQETPKPKKEKKKPKQPKKVDKTPEPEEEASPEGEDTE